MVTAFGNGVRLASRESRVGCFRWIFAVVGLGDDSVAVLMAEWGSLGAGGNVECESGPAGFLLHP